MWKQIDYEIVLGSDWKEYKRTKCEVRTRVMWYIRPVSGFNEWKKSEFYGRTAFEESKVDNSSFIRHWGNKEALES